MINRIRDIRKQKGITLAELALACDPPTTPQTVGRIETGMRTLSVAWMERIAAALEVAPESLVRSAQSAAPQMLATLGPNGSEALASPREAIMPAEIAAQASDTPLVVVEVTSGVGEFRQGDLIWLQQLPLDEAGKAINRDCLVPRSGGRFVFGRLIDRQGTMVGILPPGHGQKQQVIDKPAWLAQAVMLVRQL